MYLVQSHRWWGIAAEWVPVLLHRSGSRGPTSTASPRTEPCQSIDQDTRNTTMLSSPSLCVRRDFTSPVRTISAPGWASLPRPPPRWAWAPCPCVGGTRPGRRQRRWCADRLRWTPRWTNPRICCIWSVGGPPARPPSCGRDPWYHGLCLRMLHKLWGVLSHFVPSVQPLLEPHWTLFKARHFLFAFGTAQTGLLTFTPQGPPSAQNHHYGNQLMPH